MHRGCMRAAAAAVRMARDRGKAKEAEMEDLALRQSGDVDPATVQAAAERILGVKDFDDRLRAKLPDIRQDVADGGALQIVSTPTLFINGVRIDGQQMMPAEYFELAIQLELKKAAGK